MTSVPLRSQEESVADVRDGTLNKGEKYGSEDRRFAKYYLESDSSAYIQTLDYGEPLKMG